MLGDLPSERSSIKFNAEPPTPPHPHTQTHTTPICQLLYIHSPSSDPSTPTITPFPPFVYVHMIGLNVVHTTDGGAQRSRNKRPVQSKLLHVYKQTQFSEVYPHPRGKNPKIFANLFTFKLETRCYLTALISVILEVISFESIIHQ